MSMAPRDSHKAQIQFALERGIPAFVGILGTQRLQFPSFAFELIHCSRCLVPFSAYSMVLISSLPFCLSHVLMSSCISSNFYSEFMFEFWLCADGSYFIEVDRILRPGGYFVLSGPPVNWPGKEREYEILQELVTKKLCYTLVSITENTGIWQKPTNASCYIARQEQTPPICEDEDPNKAWSVLSALHFYYSTNFSIVISSSCTHTFGCILTKMDYIMIGINWAQRQFVWRGWAFVP